MKRYDGEHLGPEPGMGTCLVELGTGRILHFTGNLDKHFHKTLIVLARKGDLKNLSVVG